MLKNIFVPAALIGAMVVAGNAPAETFAREAQVSYADLDLSSEAGQQALARRVDNAVDEVCAPVKNLTLQERSAMQRCASGAMSGATAQMNRAIALAGKGERFAAR